MGLLFLDVTPRGIIMGSDSQDVVLYENTFRVIRSSSFRKDKISRLELKSFKGLMGYVGTEHIGATPIRSWLERFRDNKTALCLSDFSHALAEGLSKEWRNLRLKSGLWIFLSGYELGEPRFWFVNNIATLDPVTGMYRGIGKNFKAVNDLEENYIRPRLLQGATREKLLRTSIFHFRNGVISPFSQIYLAFNRILDVLAQSGDPGFQRIRTLKKHAFAARQRLEFVKRLYSRKHGLYGRYRSPISGEVNVYCINGRGQVSRVYKESFEPV